MSWPSMFHQQASMPSETLIDLGSSQDSETTEVLGGLPEPLEIPLTTTGAAPIAKESATGKENEVHSMMDILRQVANMNPEEPAPMLESMINKCMMQSDVVWEQPEDTIPTEEDGEVSIEEKRMSDALKESGFDLRGPLGQKWQKAKQDPELAARYKAVGPTHQRQKEFRLEWLKQEYEVIKKKRVKTTFAKSSDHLRGAYKTFKQIIRDEAGDHGAALNVVMECLKRHHAGKRQGGRRAYVNYNSFSKRVTFLHCEEGFDDSNGEGWEQTTEESTGDKKIKRKAEPEDEATTPKPTNKPTEGQRP